MTSWVNVTGLEWIKACLVTLVDRYESIASGVITGIRKQVVAVNSNDCAGVRPERLRKTTRNLSRQSVFWTGTFRLQIRRNYTAFCHGTV
jgi:hypothetical protein